MHVVDTSSESGSSPQRLQIEDPEHIMDSQELSVVDKIAQEYMRFNKSATELEATISHQRVANAGYEKTIAREGEISSGASAMIKYHQKRLAAAKNTIERRTAIQESLEHNLDCLIKEDATDPNVDDLKKVVSAQKDTINKIKAQLPRIGNQLASTQDKWRCSQRDQTTAINRLDRGIKMVEATVAQHNTAVAQKRRWYRAATYLHVKPDESSQVMNSQSVAAEDLREARMDIAHDEQDVAPQQPSLVPAYQEPE
ncbi:hypothetical protein F5883DRAFT_560205 [Diaporthe sp. PMI_573]|nr:hypothetical protein F5883DRAFT_560205 [Diaporthaceae sp. PMI_573]